MRRALGALLALAAALLPAPALADITARYVAGDSTLTVEADDGGDWRFQISGKTPLVVLHHEGADYVVFTDSEGRVGVVPAGELLKGFVASAPSPPPIPDVLLEAGPADSLLGYSGTTWLVGSKDTKPMGLLMSADPALAPVGDVFRHLAGMVIDALDADRAGDFGRQLVALLAKGTPLRIVPEAGAPPLIALESVSMAAIDPARFALPGPLLSADEVLDKLQR